MTARVLLAALLVAAPLCACAVDERQDVRAWRDVIDRDVPAPASDYVPGRPLGLRRALEIANAANESLAIRGEDYLQAIVAKDRAAAAFLPTVSLAPSYARQPASHLGNGSIDVSAFVPERALDVPATAGLSVNPLREIDAQDAATATAAARRAELLDFRSGLLVDVARTFYAVRIAERRAAVLGDAIRTADARVRDLETNLSVGTAAPLAVARAKADAAKARAGLIDARNSAARGRTTLAFLVGLPAIEGELGDDLAPPEPTPAPEEFLGAAREHRQDLRAALARTRAAEAGLQAAFAEYFPTVSLDFTYFFERESFPPDVDWRGVLGVQLPIFGAGRIRNDIRAAYSRLRQAKAAESLLARRIDADVRNAWRDYDDSALRRETLLERVREAEEARRTSAAALENGLATDLDVRVTEDDLREARLTLATEQLAGKLRWLLLLRSAGELESRLFETSNPKAPQ